MIVQHIGIARVARGRRLDLSLTRQRDFLSTGFTSTGMTVLAERLVHPGKAQPARSRQGVAMIRIPLLSPVGDTTSSPWRQARVHTLSLTPLPMVPRNGCSGAWQLDPTNPPTPLLERSHLLKPSPY
jgi:hypothetical protein